MIRKHKRSIKLETLEPRIVLDGNVTASVVDGLLEIRGDELDNQFEVRQIESTNGRGNRGDSFLIVPDSDTSVNGQRPGRKFRVNGVQKGVFVDSGAGDDGIVVTGRSGQSYNKLEIETGSGADTTLVRRLNLTGDLLVANSSGADQITLNPMATGGIVDISSQSSGTNVNVNGVRSSSAFIKLGSIKGESRDAAVEIKNFEARDRLNVTVESSGGDSSVRLQGIQLKSSEIKIKYIAAIPGASSVELVNVDASEQLDVDVESAKENSVRLQGVRTSRGFIKLKGIEGETQDNAVELVNVEAVGTLGLTIDTPSATTSLKARGISASYFPIDVCKVPAPPRPMSFGQFSDMQVSDRFVLRSCGPFSSSLSRVSGGGVFVYSRGNADSSERPSHQLSDVDLDGPLVMDTFGYESLDLSRVRSSSMRVSSKVTGEGKDSSLRLSDVEMGGSLIVNSSGPTSVDLSSVRCDSLRISSKSTSQQDKGASLRLSDIDMDSSLTVDTGNGSDTLDIARASVGGQVQLRMGGANDSTTITHLQAGEGLVIVGSEETNVESSEVSGPARFDGQGAGNLSVKEVTFTRRLDKASPILYLNVRGNENVDLQQVTVDGQVRVHGTGTSETSLRNVSISSKSIDKATPKLMLHMTGNESTSISSSDVEGAVSIRGTGNGSASFKSVMIVSRRVDKSSPDLMLHCANHSSTTFDGGTVEGNVRVHGTGGDTVINDLSVRTKHLDKASPKLALHLTGGQNTTVSSSEVEGAVRIRGTGQGALALKNISVTRWIDKSSPDLMLHCSNYSSTTIEGGSVEGNVRVHGAGGDTVVNDLSVRTKLLDKSSPKLALHLTGGQNTTVSSSEVEGAVRIHGTGQGALALKDVSVTRWIDKSSPDLMLHCSNHSSSVADSLIVEGQVRLQGTGGDTTLNNLLVFTKHVDKASPKAALWVGGSLNTTVTSSDVEGAVHLNGVGRGGGGSGKVKIEDLSVTKWVDKSSPDLMLRCADHSSTTIANTTIEGRVGVFGEGSGETVLDNLTVRAKELDKASVKTALEVTGSASARISSSRVDGPVSVEGSGDGELSISDVTFGDPVDKSSPILMLRSSGFSTVSCDSCEIFGNMHVDYSVRGEFGELSSLGDEQARLDVSLDDSRVSGDFTVDSFFDVFFDIDLDQLTEDQLHVVAPSSLVSSSNSSVGGNFNVDSFFDVFYQVCGSSDDQRVDVVLEGAQSELRSSSSLFGGDLSSDSFFDITYQVCTNPQNDRLRLRGEQPSSHVDVRKGDVEGTFAVDSFFDVLYDVSTGAAGEIPTGVSFATPSSTTVARGLDVAGGVTIDNNLSRSSDSPLFESSSNSASNVLFEETSVGGDLVVDSFFDVFGDVSHLNSSSFTGSGLNVEGNLLVNEQLDLSEAPTSPKGEDGQSSVEISNSSVSGGFNYRGKVKPSYPHKDEIIISAASIEVGSTDFGSLSISSQGPASCAVDMDQVDVVGESSISLGESDDQLEIVNSRFDGPATFDGGSELREDVVRLKGNRFAEKPILNDWESVLIED